MSDRLEDLRRNIDAIDRQVVDLLDQRARVVQEVGEVKREEGLDLYVPGREQKILERLETLGTGDFPVSSLRQIYREIVATCRNLEKTVTVAYLGPEASFSHAAALKQFGRTTPLHSYESVSQVFDMVEQDEVDFGIVPVESSSEGAVRHTLDRFLNSGLIIYSETYLPVNLCLLSPETSLDDLQIVYSHRQALSQARDWLDRHLPDVHTQETNSTAEAAKIASETEGGAAVASEVAAELYELEILARHIETRHDNYTRFLVIGKQTHEPTGDDKTSVVFSLEDRPGALYEVLESFERHEINMTKIESRPSPMGTWKYVFFVDFEGHQDNDTVAELLDELQKRTPFCKVLGSYPRERLTS